MTCHKKSHKKQTTKKRKVSYSLPGFVKEGKTSRKNLPGIMR
jgi:hypothetical protein